MLDKLKKSLEHLDAPYCPNCSVEMKWSRSQLVDVTTILHIFICEGRSRTTETNSTVSVGLLFRPRSCRHRAIIRREQWMIIQKLLAAEEATLQPRSRAPSPPTDR